MAADAFSFVRIDSDGLMSEKRRSGRPWKKLVAGVGESIHDPPAVARAVWPVAHSPTYLGHHARTGSVLIMTIVGLVTGAGFRRTGEEDRWDVNALGEHFATGR